MRCVHGAEGGDTADMRLAGRWQRALGSGRNLAAGTDVGARERSASEFKRGPRGADEEEASERGGPAPQEAVGPGGSLVLGVAVGEALAWAGAIWESVLNSKPTAPHLLRWNLILQKKHFLLVCI